MRGVKRMDRWAGAGRASRGFTLVEVVVALGVLSVVIISIATVFDVVGDTVTAGQRLSDVSRRRANLERQLREDFDRMVPASRGGFMVIRNELAQRVWDGVLAADEVPLNQEGEGERLRRIDELMFFVEGDFTSARAPFHPGVVARSNTARVYYGHGMRMPSDEVLLMAGERDRSRRPVLDETLVLDPMADPASQNPSMFRLGEATAAFINPNELAADWSLLRHLTLLAPASTAPSDIPSTALFDDSMARDELLLRARDHSRQVAMQPAAQSVFRSVIELRGGLFDEGVGTADVRGVRRGGASPASVRARETRGRTLMGDLDGNAEASVSPRFTSGLVDIATVTLEEIRQTVLTPRFEAAGTAPGSSVRVFAAPVSVSTAQGASALPFQPVGSLFAGATGFQSYVDSFVPGGPAAPVRSGGLLTRLEDQVQQQWMLDALPTVPFDEDFPGVTGVRMRFEDDAPSIGGAVLLESDVAGAGQGRARALLEAIEQADQEMLRASVFLRGCSEFIVEFSYGVIDSNPMSPGFGQLVWHGLRRFLPAGGGAAVVGAFNDSFTAGSDVLIADILVHDDTEVRLGGGFATSGDGRAINTLGASSMEREFVIPQEVRVGELGNAANPERLSPRIGELSLARLPGATTATDAFPATAEGPSAAYVFGYADTGEDGAGAGAWPWPRLVRITGRLVDEDDDSIEVSFQVTFPIRSGAVQGRLRGR